MMKIGEFSKICGLPVKTLRFYDQAGLLPPACIDGQTGYRYYTGDQLLTVKRILAYKEQGFTLDQIRMLLNDISQHEALDRLKRKQEELVRTMETARKQLEEVSGSIRRMEADLQLPGRGEIRVRRVKPQLAASIRDVVMRSEICLLIDEVIRHVQADAAGPVTLLWHGRPGASFEELLRSEPADIEAAVPIARPIAESGRIRVRRIPGMKAVSCLHHCDPSIRRCTAVDAIRSWAENRGGIAFGTGVVRETFLTPDRDIYGHSRLAELLVPVE